MVEVKFINKGTKMCSNGHRARPRFCRGSMRIVLLPATIHWGLTHNKTKGRSSKFHVKMCSINYERPACFTLCKTHIINLKQAKIKLRVYWNRRKVGHHWRLSQSTFILLYSLSDHIQIIGSWSEISFLSILLFCGKLWIQNMKQMSYYTPT